MDRLTRIGIFREVHMKKVLKTIGIILIAIIGIALAVLIIEEVRTKHTQDDYSNVYTDKKYQTPVKIKIWKLSHRMFHVVML